jgi:hypothetical protein
VHALEETELRKGCKVTTHGLGSHVELSGEIGGVKSTARLQSLDHQPSPFNGKKRLRSRIYRHGAPLDVDGAVVDLLAGLRISVFSRF